MASSSAVTLEHHQAPLIAPDDSDFLDSDVDQDQNSVDHEIENAILNEPHPSEVKRSRTATATPTSSSAPRPSHDLIQVSRRLWFTYFRDAAPSPVLLNRRNGRIAAPGSDGARYHWFNVDNDLVYLSFFDDWGPLNVAMFYRFCLHVHHLLTTEEQVERLVLYTVDNSYSKANIALLAALYAMIIDKVTPADAFHPFSQLEFEPFRDAGYGRPDFYLTIQDILYGMQKAISFNLLDLTAFNLDEYEHFEQVQHGDWNWLTPNFIAFASPNDRDYVAALRSNEGRPLDDVYLPKPNSTFANTIRHFKDRNVKLVVRLNNPLYDKVAFEEAGIEHLDLYFDDGSNPSDAILNRFIEKADEVVGAGGVVAVHCKAGLGRTGVLIGAYLIWKHGFTATEVIGFMRLMRPGCVVGPQQHFMYENFVDWIRKGARESALKEAHAAIAKEREAMLKAGRLPATSGRTSLKRPATPENEGSNPDDSDSAGGGGGGGVGAEADLPVTPRARKDPRLGPTAAVKPTPCVGQPRKSPSPSRKRVAPATVARLERNTASSGGNRPGLHSIGFHQPQFQRVDVPSRANDSTARRSSGGDDGAAAGSNENQNASGVHANGASAANGGTPRSLGLGVGGGGGNVLMEAQRLNLQRGTSPPSSPKTAMTSGRAVMAMVTATPPTTTPTKAPLASINVNGTPSSNARARGHERSRSAIVLGVSSDLAVNSPGSSLSRETSLRASPDIKNRYQLRDAGSRAATPSSPEAREATIMTFNDSNVLGAEPLPTDKAAAAAPTTAKALSKGDAENRVPQASVAAAAASEPLSRTRTRARAPGPETASVRASSRTTSSSSSGSGSSGPASTGTRPRQPSGTVAVRPATSIGLRPPSRTATGMRSASGKLRDARAALTSQEAEAKLRAGSVRTAAELRRSTRCGDAAGAAAGRTTSSSSTTTTATTTARQVSGSRPSSRLLAPTAASAARAAATLKRSRGISADLRAGDVNSSGGGLPAGNAPSAASSTHLSVGGGGGVLGARSVSGSARLGRNVRRRRSSMGDANVDVVA
ncbi:cell division control protein 14 [Thecaphora frezii]